MFHLFCLCNIPFYHITYLLLTLDSSSFMLYIILIIFLYPTTFLPSINFLMVPELEKPQITEIQVRMDCKGCVEKIKKSLCGIKGIYNLYIDYPQQKITVIGWADPEKIVKAIKKTRRIATICSHAELTEPAAPRTENAPESSQSVPSSESENPPTPNDQPPAPPAEAAATLPSEPAKDQPPLPPEYAPPEPEAAPSSVASETNAEQSPHDHIGEVHVIHHHPPDNHGYPPRNHYGYGHGYRDYWNRSYDHNGQGYYSQEQSPPVQPNYVTQSYYNTHRPSPYVTEYHDRAYIRSPPQRTHYNRFDHYNHEEHYNNVNNGNGNITSIFSDENPNACRIM